MKFNVVVGVVFLDTLQMFLGGMLKVVKSRCLWVRIRENATLVCREISFWSCWNSMFVGKVVVFFYFRE